MLCVGVGALLVRDFFKQAKAKPPCIVFISEFDAIGRQRGDGMGGGNVEREFICLITYTYIQTLNVISACEKDQQWHQYLYQCLWKGQQWHQCL